MTAHFRFTGLGALFVILSACGCVHNAVAQENPAGQAEMVAGAAAFRANDPVAALRHYHAALALIPAHDRAARRAAWMGVGRAALWTEQYPLAAHAYRQALALADSADDRKAISVKLARALTLLDRPREAYKLLMDAPSATAEFAVEKARAALSLGWETRAAEALHGYDAQHIAESESGWLSNEYQRQRDELDYRLRRSVDMQTGFTESNDGVHRRAVGITAKFQTLNLPGGPPSRFPALWGVGVKQEWIDDPLASLHTTEIAGSMVSNLDDNTRLDARLGVGQQGNWQYGVGALNIDYHPNDRWGAAVGLESDSIKTVLALQNHVTYNVVTISANHLFENRVVVAAALFHQPFSDGNQRTGGVMRLNLPAWTLSAVDATLDVQLFARRYHDSDTHTVGYFNPADFHEEQLRLYVAKRMTPRWIARVMGAPGLQTVDGDNARTFFGELQLRGSPTRQIRVEVKLGVGNSGAVNSTSAGYRENYLNASVSIPW